MAPDLPPLPGSISSSPTSSSTPPPLPGSLERVAKRQRELLWGILICLLLSCSASSVPLVYLFLVAAQAILLYRLGRALQLRPIALWTIGAAIPYVGLVFLFVVNQQATRLLTNAGFKVGFMGASLSNRSSNV